MKYVPSEIENKWQEKWRADKLYKYQDDPKKETYYTLVELPYPSGDLHIGHWFTFVAPDVLSRYKRMKGFNVFYPHGFDAFGLPAENAAIKRKIHPKDWTMSNIESMIKQFRTMGSIMDLDDVTITCLPEYFRWNQWIFIELYKRGLAYRGKILSNWCEFDKTVLANEHVENGNCWRCGNPVVQKEVEQWFLKITEYADRLIWPENPKVDWPMSVRTGQNNWIGKSTGVELTFKVDGSDDEITVYSTALDTVYGVTFLVVAPEHPFAVNAAKKNKDVAEYAKKAEARSSFERQTDIKDKTGVFTGQYVINPFNKEKIPVWVADYVLMGYGTGAVMAVSGHDSRDHEFAEKFKLPIKIVVEPKDDSIKVRADGFWDYKDLRVQYKKTKLVESGEFNGLNSREAKEKMEEFIEKNKWGKRKVQYHLHDWSISRQRYWGTPVPMIHCDKCGIVPVEDKNLPVELPYDVDFMPKGKPPLASNEEWLNVSCPKCGGRAVRDAETLDTFFDSSWYFFRYVSPHFKEAAFDSKEVNKRMPLDIYFGGAEHTLGHTLYARFFTKFFQDMGLVDFDEFALKRIQHGIVLGPDGNKMSKSKGNVINPDDVVKEYGADTVRMYLNFMMPYEATAAWSTGAIAGIFRFLQRVWKLHEKVTNDAPVSPDDAYKMSKVIENVERDMEQIKTNTAIAFIMDWLNHLSRKDKIATKEYKTMLLLIAPFAPHIAEELWGMIGEKYSIHNQSWPTADKSAGQSATIKIPVQVNGKVRSVITVKTSEADEKTVVERATADESVARHIEGKQYKVIYIKGKILNLTITT